MWLLPSQTSLGLLLSEITIESTMTDLVLNSPHNISLNSYRSCFGRWIFSWPHTLSDNLPQATVVISSHQSLLMFCIILSSDTGSHWFTSSTRGEEWSGIKINCFGKEKGAKKWLDFPIWALFTLILFWIKYKIVISQEKYMLPIILTLAILYKEIPWTYFAKAPISLCSSH